MRQGSWKTVSGTSGSPGIQRRMAIPRGSHVLLRTTGVKMRETGAALVPRPAAHRRSPSLLAGSPSAHAMARSDSRNA